MQWVIDHWKEVLAGLWALDQLLVSLLGKSTLLDQVTALLKSLGAGPKDP